MAVATAQPMGNLPSGLGICTTAPDIFYLPELVSACNVVCNVSEIDNDLS